VVIAAALLACACTGRGRPGESLYSGPDVVAAENPFGVQWSWDTLAPIEGELAGISGGATVVDVVWCDVEPDPGRMDFSDVDERVGAVVRLGFRPMMRIRVGTCWATGDPGSHGSPSRPPVDMAAYGAFVEAAAARHPEVHYFSLEGFLDASASWDAPPEAYAQLVEPGAAAIRRGVPGASVSAAGVSSESLGVLLADDLLATGGSDEAVKQWNDFYERRARQAGARFSASTSIPELQSELRGEEAARVRDATAVLMSPAVASHVDGRQLQYFEKWQYLDASVNALVRRDPSRRPYAGWEMGVAWPGDTYEDVVAADDVAKLLVEGLLMRLAPLVYTPAVSGAEEIGGSEVLRGLYLPVGAPKPAADVMRTLVAAAAGEGIVVRRVGSGDLRGAGIGRGDSATLVVWSDGKPVHVAGAAPPGASAASAIGDPLEWSDTGLSIGSAPTVLSFAEPVGDAVRRVEAASAGAGGDRPPPGQEAGANPGTS